MTKEEVMIWEPERDVDPPQSFTVQIKNGSLLNILYLLSEMFSLLFSTSRIKHARTRALTPSQKQKAKKKG